MVTSKNHCLIPNTLPHQEVARLLLYIYKATGRRAKRRVHHQSLNPKTVDIRLVEELHERLLRMESIERRLILGANNNTARELTTWWQNCHKSNRPFGRKTDDDLRRALAQVVLPRKEDLDP